jgi:hypothetical protein
MAQNLCCCSNLTAVHLNDNGIVSSYDQELMMELLDIFGLSDLGLQTILPSDNAYVHIDY